MRSVVGIHFVVHGIAVESGVLVAAPRVDSITSGGERAFLYCLAEAEVGLAILRSQLDQELRLQRSDQVIGERKMSGPRGDAAWPIPSWAEAVSAPSQIIS